MYRELVSSMKWRRQMQKKSLLRTRDIIETLMSPHRSVAMDGLCGSLLHDQLLYLGYSFGKSKYKRASKDIFWTVARQAYRMYFSFYLSYNSFPGSSLQDTAFCGGRTYGAATFVAPLHVTLLVRKFRTRVPISAGVISLAEIYKLSCSL